MKSWHVSINEYNSKMCGRIAWQVIRLLYGEIDFLKEPAPLFVTALLFLKNSDSWLRIYEKLLYDS